MAQVIIKKQIRETLISMGFQPDYIRRAFKGYEKHYGYSYNIEVITKIIVRLQNKDKAKLNDKSINKKNKKTKNQDVDLRNKPPQIERVNISNNNNQDIPPQIENKDNNIPFQSHITMQDAFKLNINDKIDHRDQIGRFVCATIMEKQGTNLKIHYDGWSRKWDTWSDFNVELYRFAKAESRSKRPAHRFKQLKKGDYIDINPTHRHPGWKCGEFRRLDRKSGQIQVVYESSDRNYLYWTHLDNTEEIAPFASKSTKQIVAGCKLKRDLDVLQFTELRMCAHGSIMKVEANPLSSPISCDVCKETKEAIPWKLNRYYQCQCNNTITNWCFSHTRALLVPIKVDLKRNQLKKRNKNKLNKGGVDKHKKKEIVELISDSHQKPIANVNNSKKKRKLNHLNDYDGCDNQPSLKKRKLSHNCNNNNNNSNSNNRDTDDILDENKMLKQQNETLQKRLDLFEVKSEKISVMNLDELNEIKNTLKNIFQSKIKLIEEAEKELIDNKYKCVACMDKAKNISFMDGCSHVALCDECEASLQIKKCPICQKPYKNAKKINF